MLRLLSRMLSLAAVLLVASAASAVSTACRMTG